MLRNFNLIRSVIKFARCWALWIDYRGKSVNFGARIKNCVSRLAGCGATPDIGRVSIQMPSSAMNRFRQT